MRETIIGVVFTLFMAAFCASSCWLSWQEGKAKSGKSGKKAYKTGDRVRLVQFLDDDINGRKGTLRSPGMAMFDWIVNLDSGEPMGVYEGRIEPLRWWKFWRSRRVR